jgi:hypothetical protein
MVAEEEEKELVSLHEHKQTMPRVHEEELLTGSADDGRG